MHAELNEFLLEIMIKISQREKNNHIMKYAHKEEKNVFHRDLYPSIYILELEKSIKNRKNALYQMQNSAELFYFKQLLKSALLLYFKEWLRKYALISQLSLQFFTTTWSDGMHLWEYDEISEEYNSQQMISNEQSGEHRRGEINEEGIYVVAGYRSKNMKIYDMKFYNYPEHKIQLLDSFSHSSDVYECFYKNLGCAICCDLDGYIKEYDLNNPLSVPPPTVFNKTALRNLRSCMQTKDKNYIIAGSSFKLYILDAEDGTLLNTIDYSANGGYYAWQIAEIRPNILVTADFSTGSVHDIRNIQNIPISIKLPNDIGYYYSVISLGNNSGDFAIGGKSSITNLGFVYIQHLEEDNKTISTLKYVEDIQGRYCSIYAIKELKRGIIIFGGDSACTEICIWNYAAKHFVCWQIH